MERNTFTVWDYLVFSLVLAVSAGIGIFYGCFKGRNRTTQEFLMANREMQIVPITLSLLASFMSAVTILGVPADIYIHGTQFMVIGIAYAALMPIVAFIYVPIFYNLKITSAYEYLEMRYRKPGMKFIGSVTFLIQMILYMAIVLYAPCLALNAVTGLNLWASVISVGVICTFYTALGGMKAVMWTDVFQVTMMIIGMTAVLIKGSIDQGGFANVWQIAKEGERIEFFNFDPDPRTRHTVWSLTIGGIFQWLAIYGINQSQVQRALTSPKLRNAQIAILLNAPGLILILLLTSFSGLVAYAHFKDCDPLNSGVIHASDQILPLYVMVALDLPGIPGLFVACVFSASLSTISSGLNSLAAVTMQDFVKGHFFKDMSEQRATLCAKILALVFGVLMMLLSVVASQLGAVLQAALSTFGMFSAPLLGLFTLGMFFKQANWKGGVVGWIIALLFQLWMGIGAYIMKPPVPTPPRSIEGCDINGYNNTNITTEATTFMYTSVHYDISSNHTDNVIENNVPLFYDIYRISYLWYSLIALLMVLVIGLPVSILTGGEDQNKLNPKTVINMCEVFCPCLPQRWKQSCTSSSTPQTEEDESYKIYSNNNRMTEKGELGTKEPLMNSKTGYL